jgi:hypothetical protein
MQIWQILVLWSALFWVTLPASAQSPSPESPAPSGSEMLSQSKVTAGCQLSIERGHHWLISAMRRDGAIGTDIGEPPDLGCTAITGLAILAHGDTPFTGPHREELRRLLDYLLTSIERLPTGDDPVRPGTLVRRKIGRNADLFLCALFLSQALGETPGYENDIRLALEKLVSIICHTQGRDGTWGNESWAPVLGTVLGWESLRAASSCGLTVDASAQLAGDALIKHLKTEANKDADWMHNFYKSASSVRVLYSLNYRDDPIFIDCVNKILKVVHSDNRPFVQAGGEEYLAFFLVTECLLQLQESQWQSWYPTVRDKLMSTQNTDGSWSGHHCIKGRTFCTAAALLTLQAPNLCLPISNL